MDSFRIETQQDVECGISFQEALIWEEEVYVLSPYSFLDPSEMSLAEGTH